MLRTERFRLGASKSLEDMEESPLAAKPE